MPTSSAPNARAVWGHRVRDAALGAPGAGPENRSTLRRHPGPIRDGDPPFASWNLIGDFLSKVAALRRGA
jgi:hypothetical protein